MLQQNQAAYLSHSIHITNLAVRPNYSLLGLAMLVAASLIISGGSGRPFRISVKALNLLLYLVLCLCVTTALLCMLTIVYSRAYSLPDGLSQFGLMRCADSPCFIGMMPSRTSWTEVQAKFKDCPVVKLTPVVGLSQPPSFIFRIGTKGDIVLSPTLDGIFLGTVFANFVNQSITVGDIIEVYGEPSYITIDSRTGHVMLNYPRLYATTELMGHRLNPNAPIKYIVLSNSNAYSKEVLYHCHAKDFFDVTNGYSQVEDCPWYGFTSLENYRAKQ